MGAETEDTMRRSIRVSIVVPLYDSAALLQETLSSIAQQTLPDREVVLVDDGANAETRALAERLVAERGDASIRLVHQPNGGVASARNHGIAVARGRYVLPLDDDDRIAPTMLEECARVLDERPGVDIVFTDRHDFGEVDRIWRAGRFTLDRLKAFNQISYASLYRRAVWEAVGGYRTNVSGFDDWDFWVAAAARGCTAHHLPKPLLQHRIRRGSQMWRILPEYARLHARVVLNNPEAYGTAERDAAARFLAGGAVPPFLRAAAFIFTRRFLDDYEEAAAARREHPCAS